jgi:uncharacterized protein
MNKNKSSNCREKRGNMVEEMSFEEIESFLSNSYIGRIGFSHEEEMHIIPMTYFYDKNNSTIIGYSNVGLKILAMRENPSVCFQLDEIKDLRNWKSVSAKATYNELTGADAKFALHTFTEGLNSIFAEKGNKPVSDFSSAFSEKNNFVIFQLKLRDKTGRVEEN